MKLRGGRIHAVGPFGWAAEARASAGVLLTDGGELHVEEVGER